MILRARYVGRLNGRKVFRVPFRIVRNDSRRCTTVDVEEGEILAYSATDAANWLRDRYPRPETEFYAWGPQGGQIHRYHGWESYIAAAMWQSHRERRGQITEQRGFEL